jgi:hypothetical protein
MTPANATAISPAMRDTALLMAEPIPLSPGPTAERMAEVSGATVMARPNPHMSRPGSSCVQKSTGIRAAVIIK